MDEDSPTVGRTIATGICFLSFFTRISANCLEKEYVLGWSAISLEENVKSLTKVTIICHDTTK
jgi:hypothetical protein